MNLWCSGLNDSTTKKSPNNFMLCDCVVKKILTEAACSPNSTWETFLSGLRAVKIPFDKSQTFFASKSACGFGELCGGCLASAENLMKQ